jgi:hypothetical protein
MYDRDRPCPKCGNDRCDSNYRPASLWLCQPHDRVFRRCGRCQHGWLERPLDWTAKHDKETADRLVAYSKEANR